MSSITSLDVAVTDDGKVRVNIRNGNIGAAVQADMTPSYAKWFASEIVAAAERALKVPAKHVACQCTEIPCPCVCHATEPPGLDPLEARPVAPKAR